MDKQVEKIRVEIERHLECVLDFIDSLPEKEKQWKPVPKREPAGVLKELLDNIDEKELEETRKEMMEEAEKEEPVSKDLEEVFGHMADTYYNDVLMDEHPMPEDIAHHCRLSYFRGLKDGANYQKQQDYIPVSKDLEAEIQRYYSNVGYPKYVQTARHFARWQEQQDEKDTSDMLVVTYLRGGDEGKKIMVDKACKWLDGVIWEYIDLSNVPVNTHINIDNNKFLQDFRKAMEE